MVTPNIGRQIAVARFKALLPFFLKNVFLSDPDRGSELEMAIWQLVVVLVLVGTIRSEFIDEW